MFIIFILLLWIILSNNIPLCIEGGSGPMEIPFTSNNIRKLIPKNAIISLDSEWATFNDYGHPINIDRCKLYDKWRKDGKQGKFRYNQYWPKTKIPYDWDVNKQRQKVCIISIALSEDNILVFRAFGSGSSYSQKDLDDAIDTLRSLNPTIYVFGGGIEIKLLKGYDNINELQPLIDGNQRGLKTTIKKEFGVDLSKEQQCSNWYLMPLTKQQYKYAKKDAFWIWRLYKKN